MFSGLSTSDTVNLIATVFVIGTVSILALVIIAIVAPERLLASSEQMTAAWAPGELGRAATFREPADLDEVDARARWHARAAVIYSPAPIRTAPAHLDMAPLVGARIDELMSVSPDMFLNSSGARTSVNPSSRYYRASVAEFVSDYAPRAISATPAPAGRHRAAEPALVAA